MTVDLHGVTLDEQDGSDNQTEAQGMKITTKTACTLITITKHTSCNATRAVLKDSSLNTLATASFSGDSATFSYSLSNSTTYYVLADNNGGSYHRRFGFVSLPLEYPISGTNVDWIAGRQTGADIDSYALNIVSIETTTGGGGGTLGTADINSFYVKNGSSWTLLNHYDYFTIKKGQNQVSSFEIKIYDIQATEKAYFKEQAEVLFFAGLNLILKGRIQKIQYDQDNGCVANGFGMESKLLDSEFIYNGDNRVQFDNTSAKTIAQNINNSILTTASSGLWSSDYGNLTMRFEYANRLNSISKLADTIDYEWYVSHTSADTYSANYLNISPYQATSSAIKTYTIGLNCEAISQEKDLNNMCNYVNVLGYGDGINQLNISTYAASTTSGYLLSDITSATITSATITTSEGAFATSGTLRISEEIMNYTNSSGSTFKIARGVSSSTAMPHKKGAYVEPYFPYTSSQSGSSIYTYGVMDDTLIDRTVIDTGSAELAASAYLFERKNPIVKIIIRPNEPITDAALQIGSVVTITDTNSALNGNYRIVGLEYTDNYGDLQLILELSNRSLDFIDQINKSREEQKNLGKYMQGATNIYSLSEGENCDASYPLNMRFYVPSEATAINKVLLNFKLKNYRAYESGNAAGGGQTVSSASGGSSTPSSATAEGGEYQNDLQFIFNEGTIHNHSTLLFTKGNVVPDSPTGTFAGAIVTVTIYNSSGTDSSDDVTVQVYNDTTSEYIGSASSIDCDNGYFKSVNFSFDTSQVSVGDVLYIKLTNIHGGSAAGCSTFGFYKMNIQSLSTHTHEVTIPSHTHNVTTSDHTHTINYGIYEETLTSPSVVVVAGVEGSEASVGTYNSDQTSIDITSKVLAAGPGNWCNIKFTPNKRMRIEANAYVQIFLESK